MKRLFLSFVLAVFAAVSVFAAKSNGRVHVFAQPDGTTVSVRLLGDEHFSWYQTSDGVLLEKVNNAFYVAKTDNDGVLGSSGVLAHNLGARSEQELQAIKMQDKSLFFSSANEVVEKSLRKIIAGYPSASYCPHSGTVRVPIILMNYSDMSLTMDKTVWEEYFNGTDLTPYSKTTRFQGYGSVASFFGEASNGQLNFVFDIYGPYTADNVHDYYGDNKGKSKGLELLKEAVSKAEDDIDFSQYDSNDDGYVDMAYVLYAGTGANISADDNDFWPACWYSQGISTADGKTINVIGGSNELCLSAADNDGTALRAGIGVLCHEMSHGLGLPDLYWTSETVVPKDEQGYVDYNNCGPEDWDLMDGGENLYNGIWPCQYAAWEREILGWITPEDLTEPADVTVYPLNKEGGNIFRVTNPANPNEYYIIENYMKDEWNYYINAIYGSGLMITHVNAGDKGLSMAPNNTYGKPNVTILPADGFILAAYSEGQTIWYKDSVVTMPDIYETDEDGNYTYNWTTNYYRPEMKGDPYVGSKSAQPVTQLAEYKNYAGEEMAIQYPITDITRNEDGSISFKFMGGAINGIVGINDNNNKQDNSTYNIQGQKVTSGYRGLIIKNGKKFINK